MVWGDFSVLAWLCGLVIANGALLLALDAASRRRHEVVERDVASLDASFRQTLALARAGVLSVDSCDGGLPQHVRERLAFSRTLDAVLAADMHPAILAQVGEVAKRCNAAGGQARIAIVAGDIPTYFQRIRARRAGASVHRGDSFLVCQSSVVVFFAPDVVGAPGSVLVEIRKETPVARSFEAAFEATWDAATQDATPGSR
jgi:hypothetical protein